MKIALIGYGKMGHEVERAALQQKHEIVVRIDNLGDWENGLENIRQADVAIEFSMPDQAVDNIYRCFDLHLPVVVGTTAWYDRLEEVRQRCHNEHQSLFYAPNFSIGMNLTFMLNKVMARFSEKYGYAIRLSETHHIHKLDKPSGTAVKLADDIIAANSYYDSWTLSDKAPGNTLHIEVKREGEINGIHCITMESDVDRIILTHEAKNRQGLALGALAAAQYLQGKTGCFNMEDLLNDSNPPQ